MRPASRPTSHTVEDEAAFWSREASVLLSELGSGLKGLSSGEAARRLRTGGPNSIHEELDTGLVRLALRQFKSPLVLILVFGGVVSASLRDWLDAAIILPFVLGSCGLGFLQEYRASTAVGAAAQAARADGARAARRRAAHRSRRASSCPATSSMLSAGNLVPADGVVLGGRDFLVTEASLTGESFPVEKQPGVLPADTPLGAAYQCGLPRHVGAQRHGHGAGRAHRRAHRLRRGGAAACAPRRRRPSSPAACASSACCCVRVMVVMVLFVLIVNQWLGRPVDRVAAVRRRAGGRPVARTAAGHRQRDAVARARGGWRASGVIVRRLEAIENLGSMDVLCTDKTGTLTEGVMTLEARRRRRTARLRPRCCAWPT